MLRNHNIKEGQIWVNNVSGYESPIKDDFVGEKIIGKFDNKFCLVKMPDNKLANLWCGKPHYFNHMD